MSQIGKRYKLSIEDIKFWNNLSNDNIYLNQKLNLYFSIEFRKKVKLGMTSHAFKQLIIIPPLDSCISTNSRFEDLNCFSYNIDQKTDELNNKNVCNLNLMGQNELSQINFYFIQDTLSIIQIIRRGHDSQNFKLLINHLNKLKFNLRKIDFESYLGYGFLFGQNLTIELGHATEMAVTSETYYIKSETTLNYRLIEK